MSMAIRGAMLALAVTAGASGASAAVLDFENIPFTQFQANWNGYRLENTESFNPPGYGNLNWSSEFTIVKSTGYGARQPGGAPAGNGIENGLVSGDWVAINGGAAPVKFEAVNNGVFNLTSAYMAAAWYNGLQVLVQGFLDGVQVYSKNTGPLGFNETLVTFDWVNIDEVRFASVDGTGTVIDNQSTYNRAFVMDNLTVSYVPESGSIALLLAGLAGLILAAQGRRNA